MKWIMLVPDFQHAGGKMKTYKQRIYAALDAIVDKYPRAKASDMIWALEAMSESIWRSISRLPKKGRRVIERTKKYRVV